MGNTRKALETLQNSVLPQSEFYNDLLVLTANFNDNNKAVILGIQDPKENQQETNRINQRLLMFIDALEEEDLKTPTPVSIQNTLLVLTPDQNRQVVMQDLFFRLGMTTTQVRVFDERLTWKDYEIIVFDNEDLAQSRDKSPEELAVIKAREEQIKHALTESHAVLVHYGGYLDLVNQHRNRMQAANSRFTLYARIREVAEFLEAMKV